MCIRDSSKNGKSKAGKPVTRPQRLKAKTRTRVLPNCQQRTLKVLNEKTGEFISAPMADVWESGIKPIFEVVTAKGQVIGASADHLFYTKTGWKKLKDLTIGECLATPGLVAGTERPYPPALRQGIGVWTSMMRPRLLRTLDTCYVCEGSFRYDDLELDHVVPVIQDLKRALDETNLRPICAECHRLKTNEEQALRSSKTKQGVRWTPIVEVRPCGEEMTYDIGVESEHHNFLADGVVVHNSYNEMSGRYVQMPDMHYVPDSSRFVQQSKTNKQASGPVPLSEDVVIELADIFKSEQEDIYAHYEEALEAGLAREVARINTPVSRYSRMWAKGNLGNWLRFLKLRLAENAQYEIRVYAEAVASIVKQLWPRTWALFEEYTLYAKTLSRTEYEEYKTWLSSRQTKTTP